jgi:hypothetical protein
MAKADEDRDVRKEARSPAAQASCGYAMPIFQFDIPYLAY